LYTQLQLFTTPTRHEVNGAVTHRNRDRKVSSLMLTCGCT